MAELRPWMAWAGWSSDGAILVFAADRREALRLGWKGCRGWIADEYTDLRVRRIRTHEAYLMSLYDGQHQIVDDPPTCPVCEFWGAPLFVDRPGCERCGGEDAEYGMLVEDEG